MYVETNKPKKRSDFCSGLRKVCFLDSVIHNYVDKSVSDDRISPVEFLLCFLVNKAKLKGRTYMFEA